MHRRRTGQSILCNSARESVDGDQRGQRMESYDWLCPFCGRHATIGSANTTAYSSTFDDKNKYGPRFVSWRAITCPNPECREYVFHLSVHEAMHTPRTGTYGGVRQYSWQLVPAADMKILPTY